MNNQKYLKLGKYLKDYPSSFLGILKVYNGKKIGMNEVNEIIGLIHNFFTTEKYYTTTANLQLSRFITATNIIKKRLRTCGSISAICTLVLRKLGIPTKLIDGKIYKDGRWRTHSWIEVYIEDDKSFVSFDPFSKDYFITKNHKKRGEYIDWSDLKEK